MSSWVSYCNQQQPSSRGFLESRIFESLLYMFIGRVWFWKRFRNQIPAKKDYALSIEISFRWSSFSMFAPVNVVWELWISFSCNVRNFTLTSSYGIVESRRCEMSAFSLYLLSRFLWQTKSIICEIFYEYQSNLRRERSNGKFRQMRIANLPFPPLTFFSLFTTLSLTMNDCERKRESRNWKSWAEICTHWGIRVFLFGGGL